MSNEETTASKRNWRDWRYWRNLCAFAVCAAVLAGAAGIVRLSYHGAMNYVHPRRLRLPPGHTPALFGIVYQDTMLLTKDGVELSAWYTAARNGAVILVAHGYGAARSAEMHAIFARKGFGVISWDARAHGTSGGETSTMGYRESLDVEAALDYALVQQGVHHVGAYGQSMGATAVIRAAAHRREIAVVVADSAYPTLQEMIAPAVRYPALRPFVRFFAEREAGISAEAMRPVDEIARISPRPVFIIHGGSDHTVPAESARRLYDAAGEPRAIWIGRGVTHGAMRAVQPDDYDRRVLAFFVAALNAK